MSAVSSEALVLGIISALAAGDTEAVHGLMFGLAATDAKRAGDVMEALQRGTRSRKSNDSGPAS